MDIYGQIKKAIQDMSGNDIGQACFFTVTVTAVNGQTCDAKLGGLELTGIRLRAVINNSTDQVLLKPVIGSNVLVVDLSNGQFRELAVIKYSEVEEYSLKIGETTIKATSSGIELNGFQFGGVVKVNEIATWMAKVHADLLDLQEKLLLHPVTGNGFALGMVFNPTTNAPLASQISNDKVKHG